MDCVFDESLYCYLEKGDAVEKALNNGEHQAVEGVFATRTNVVFAFCEQSIRQAVLSDVFNTWTEK